jgi:hypothetical protein
MYGIGIQEVAVLLVLFGVPGAILAVVYWRKRRR